jgi:hypothetical protein
MFVVSVDGNNQDEQEHCSFCINNFALPNFMKKVAIQSNQIENIVMASSGIWCEEINAKFNHNI